MVALMPLCDVLALKVFGGTAAFFEWIEDHRDRATLVLRTNLAIWVDA